MLIVTMIYFSDAKPAKSAGRGKTIETKPSDLKDARRTIVTVYQASNHGLSKRSN